MTESYLVCGSRDWPEDAYGFVARKMAELIPPGSLVITGGARGVDDYAHREAVRLGYPTKVMPADWERYGKRAGYLRNIAMLDEQPHAVIAFCAKSSAGTMHTIRVAQGRKIPVYWFKDPRGEPELTLVNHPSEIPETAEEQVTFWETHDASEIWDKLEDPDA